jgi:hypothetical protein
MIPVLFPDNREFSSGDRFDYDCVRHHVILLGGQELGAGVTIWPEGRTAERSPSRGRACLDRCLDEFEYQERQSVVVVENSGKADMKITVKEGRELTRRHHLPAAGWPHDLCAEGKDDMR